MGIQTRVSIQHWEVPWLVVRSLRSLGMIDGMGEELLGHRLWSGYDGTQHWFCQHLLGFERKVFRIRLLIWPMIESRLRVVVTEVIGLRLVDYLPRLDCGWVVDPIVESLTQGVLRLLWPCVNTLEWWAVGLTPWVWWSPVVGQRACMWARQWVVRMWSLEELRLWLCETREQWWAWAWLFQRFESFL